MSSFLTMCGIWGKGMVVGMAAPSGGGAGGQAGGVLQLLPMFLIILFIFYFLIFRPQQKKQKEQKEMMSSLKKGDQVVTAGGVHGVVASVKDNVVLVKVAENVKIEFSKSAIAGITSRETGES